jgi:FKBP-type peptidyl-prolyl cis-trans isomerase
VKIHYVTRLIDGTVFDSSRDRGQPVNIKLDQVVKGWSEGMQLMTVGSLHRLHIPGALAYPQGGAGCPGGPAATLVIEVELLAIE